MPHVCLSKHYYTKVRTLGVSTLIKRLFFLMNHEKTMIFHAKHNNQKQLFVDFTLKYTDHNYYHYKTFSLI